MLVKRVTTRLQNWAWQRQLPKQFTLTALEPEGVTFEALSLVDCHRIVNYGYEQSYLRAMLETLRTDDILYDVGANAGLVSLHSARKCTTIAFEPDPSFRARLVRNLELNPGATVQVRPLAISDSDGTATLYTDGAGGNSPSLVHQRDERASIMVPTSALDSIVARGDCPRPTILKLDIEGAEILALRGATALLAGPSAPRALFLEVHDTLLPAFGSSATEVLGMVRAAGYRSEQYMTSRFDQQHFILMRE